MILFRNFRRFDLIKFVTLSVTALTTVLSLNNDGGSTAHAGGAFGRRQAFYFIASSTAPGAAVACEVFELRRQKHNAVLKHFSSVLVGIVNFSLSQNSTREKVARTSACEALNDLRRVDASFRSFCPVDENPCPIVRHAIVNLHHVVRRSVYSGKVLGRNTRLQPKNVLDELHRHSPAV